MAAVRLAELLPFSFARDPRSRLHRFAVGASAIALSAGLHTGLPFFRLPHAEHVKSRIVMEFATPPPPLPVPVADEPEDGPADDPDPPPPARPLADEKAPVEPAPEEVEAPVEPPPQVAEQTAPQPAPSTAPVVEDAQHKTRADKIAERIAQRRAMMDAARAAAAARRAAREAGKGDGANGGAAPIAATEQGDPEAVFLCEANARGRQVQVLAERGLTSWVTVIPTALVGFETRPGIGSYLDDVAQVLQREKKPRGRLGIVEFALPAEVLQFELDAPRGVRVALGRGDGRCLVGLKYTAQLFPITMKRVPMRVIDRANRTQDALVDIQFFKDASFEITSVDGGELAFTKGKIKNARAIATNIEDHYQAARLAKAVAGFFGVDLRKSVQGNRGGGDVVRRRSTRVAR